MSNRRTLAFAAILALLCAVPVVRADASKRSEHDSYWHERKSFFDAFRAPAAVVMVGDSLTDGAEWSELFPGAGIANRGISGDTTAGVLERMDAILALHSSKAFVMIGINDFFQGDSVEAVAQRYGRIVAALRGNGAEVFVQSTLFCNAAKTTWAPCAAANEKVKQLNRRLAALDPKTATFIDLNRKLSGATGLKGELTYDGVHLNGEGYRLWRDAISQYMPKP